MHRHQPTDTINLPYFGSVSKKTNPRAHGGYCELQKCDCGATRKVNKNGGQEERGPWTLPTE